MVPTNTNNRGDDAVFYQLCRILRKKYYKPNITVALRHPSKSYDNFFKVKSIKNFEYKNKKSSLGKFYKGFNFNDENTHLKKFYEEIRKADKIIIGGSPFEGVSSEDVLYGQASYAHYIAFLAKILNVKYDIYAMKQTHIKNNKLLKLTKFVVENAENVYLREKYSLGVLKKFKIRNNHCKIIGDPVFDLKVDRKQIENAGKKLEKKYRFNTLNNKSAIICYRDIYWLGSRNYKKHKSKIIYLCKKLLENKFLLYFVPLQDYQTKFEMVDNDNIILNQLKRDLKKDKKIIVFDKGIDLFQTLYLAKKSNFAISNRRHISAFSYLMKKKCFGLVEDGNRENVIPMFKYLKMEKNLIDIDKLNSEMFKSKISKLLNV